LAYDVQNQHQIEMIRRNLLATCFVFPAAVVAFQQLPSTRGLELFTRHCALCHGATDEGASGPDLTNPQWQAGISDQDLERTLREGVRGTAMPAFSDRLNAGDLQSLVRHLRSLVTEAIQPANNLRAPRIRIEPDRLLTASTDSDNWLMYGRDYSNQRFSPLSAIRRDNVRNLVPVWSFQTGVPDV
jgi:mono/diheme cytochrome c family protein